MFSKFIKRFDNSDKEVKSQMNNNNGMRSSLEFLPRFINQYDVDNKNAEHLFKTNVVVYRCISLIARSIASIDWYLTDESGPIEKHELDYLLHSPNPLQSREGFLENLVTNLLLYGNAYIYRTGSALYSWQVLKPNQLELRYTHKGLPDYYQYTKADHVLKVPINKDTGESDILNIKLFNANHDQVGMSPCDVIAKVVQFYNQITEHNISLLKKGGRPSGVFSIKSEGLSREEFQELQDRIDKQLKGASNAGEVLILTDNCSWQPTNPRSLETNFIEGQHAAARQIAQVFGVPPMLIGIEGDSTFSNYKEARVHFWEDTVLPMMQRICGEINVWMFKHYGTTLVPDINNIEALEPKKHEKWLETEKVNFLTINEKRARFGYAPLTQAQLQQAQLAKPAFQQS